LDEEKKTITISTPGENKVELSDNGKYIKLTDENKNEITMDNGGITFLSSKDVIMSAKGSIQMCADTDINWNAKKDACLEGLNVNVHGKVSAIVKGNATAELSASGQATVGDTCVCTGPPDTIVKGSTTVMIGGKPAARMGDGTAHGGIISTGCCTVHIGG